MSEQDMERLLEHSPPSDKGSPLSLLLLFILVVLLPLVLALLGVYRNLPSPLAVLAGWLIALLAGLLVASFALVALTAAWIKNRLIGVVASTLVFLFWLGWIYTLTRPGGASTIVPALLLGLGVLALPALWFLRPAYGFFAGLASVIWLGVWVWLTFFLRQYGVGVLLLACAAGATGLLLTGLYFAAGFLLPVVEKDGQRGKVFKCLRDHTLGINYPYYVILDEPREEDRAVQQGKGSSFSQFAVGPGIIISGCHHAVAVSDGIKFKGVQGPGVIFTTFGDRPMHTLDLRPQLRTATAKGLTQDGIQVEVLLFAPCQVNRGGQEPQLGKPFPYRKRAAFQVVHKQEIEHPTAGQEEIRERTWEELPATIGKLVLQNILSQYRFDDLYDPFHKNLELPRVRIAKEFADQLREKMSPLGIHLVGGGISNIFPVEEEVLKQRIGSWRAEWSRRVMVKQAESQTDWLLRIEQARAEAQADLILALGKRLSALDHTGARVTPEMVVPHFLRILEELALRPALRRYIPPGTAQDVRRLRETYDE
jgi:regulator of protease activity HflC (stomatin/prohibitin superfamily)